MTKGEFGDLQPGDIIRHKLSEHGMIVHENDGQHVTAVRTAVVTNPDEWDLIRKTGSVHRVTPDNQPDQSNGSV